MTWTAEDVLRAARQIAAMQKPQIRLVMLGEQWESLLRDARSFIGPSLGGFGSLFGLEFYVKATAFEAANLMRELIAKGLTPAWIGSGSETIDALVMAALEE